MILKRYQEDWSYNIMPWKKGQSGNPNGRPKKDFALTKAIEDALSLVDVKSGYNTISRNKAIAEILTHSALKGNLKAIDMILDRIEGKPMQKTDLEITKKGAFAITIIEPDDIKSK